MCTNVFGDLHSKICPYIGTVKQEQMRFSLAGENPAIVVGNAQPTLVDWLAEQPQNGRIVFTNAHIARGILEGLCRHGLY